MAGRRVNTRDPDEKLSRLLAKVLRHEARSLGLPIQSDGFIYVSELLRSSRFSEYTEADIDRVVNRYANHRFTLVTEPSSGRKKIKANQAHSLDVPDLQLEEITDPGIVPVLIHITTEEAWTNIRREGLKRMSRRHIHLSPGEHRIYTSKLPSCKVRIYVDAARAMADGIRFYRSANDVILSPGNQNDAIPAHCFQRVELHSEGRITRLMG